MKKAYLLLIFLMIIFISGCSSDTKTLTDSAKGYSLKVPSNFTFDFSLAKSYTKCVSDDVEIFVSRENSVYDDVLYYIDHYFDNFVNSPNYQISNNISLNLHTMEKIKNKRVKILSVTRKPYEGSEIQLNTYTYAYILLDDADKTFFRLMFKSKEFNESAVMEILNSFKEIKISGEVKNAIDTEIILPDWNEETSAFYQNLRDRESTMWGIFMPDDATSYGNNNSISDLEEKLDFQFEISMKYSHIPSEAVPKEKLSKIYEDGKIAEFTIQTATFWNNDLEVSVNPNFQVLDGVLDDEIKEYARAVKNIKRPVIMRLNNEMNTDWTSYCGVQLMEDPEIYKAIFKRVAKLFKDEGADNAIWVFNPQFGDSPPANFNNFMAYFPGADTVQILGITAYNTGSYEQEQNHNTWKSFEQLYLPLAEAYKPYFGEWPWIIGEFGCDSHGGDKAEWITDMFNKINDYKNIKGAIWLNWERRDTRKGYYGEPVVCYRIEETKDTLKAFRDGLHGK